MRRGWPASAILSGSSASVWPSVGLSAILAEDLESIGIQQVVVRAERADLGSSDAEKNVMGDVARHVRPQAAIRQASFPKSFEHRFRDNAPAVISAPEVHRCLLVATRGQDQTVAALWGQMRHRWRHSGHRPKASGRLSLYLNVLTPGWTALGRAVERIPRDNYETVTWPYPVKGEYVSLHADFFSEAMIDRVFALSLRSVGRAAAADPSGIRIRFGNVTSDRQDSMKDLAQWATGRSERVSDDALYAWIRSDRSLTRQQQEIIFKYADNAASVSLPTDVSEIVDFLVPEPEYALTWAP